MNFPNEVFELNRHLVAFLSGIVGGSIPNQNSNIPPTLMGMIVAFLATKVLIGDYDVGYQWTGKDFWFAFFTLAEGYLGATVVNLK
jgi:hypothetical protein